MEHYHRELGKIVWEYCGMARNETGLEKALSEIPALREEFRKNVKVLGSPDGINTMLEKVNRVDDFMEFAELKVRDALHRKESCGGHFREEYQTEDHEALRDFLYGRMRGHDVGGRREAEGAAGAQPAVELLERIAADLEATRAALERTPS